VAIAPLRGEQIQCKRTLLLDSLFCSRKGHTEYPSVPHDVEGQDTDAKGQYWSQYGFNFGMLGYTLVLSHREGADIDAKDNDVAGQPPTLGMF
jgi:hypothetical protein